MLIYPVYSGITLQKIILPRIILYAIPSLREISSSEFAQVSRAPKVPDAGIVETDHPVV